MVGGKTAVSVDTLGSLLREGATLRVEDGGKERAEETKKSPPATTPEYDSFLRFAERCKWKFDDEAKLFPGSRPIDRASGVRMADVTERYLVGSRPLVVTDALSDWKARSTWSPDYFSSTFGDTAVICNDRAPARIKDRAAGRPQKSVKMPLKRYVSYMKAFKHENDEGDPPLYLNGWHAFKTHPGLLDDVDYATSSPYFVEDHTRMILGEIDKAITGRGKASAPGASGGEWIHSTDVLLNKVFMGPAGNITRLHFDAHRAHGWLAQVKGRKLFLLYPPRDTPKLYPLEGEATTQSPVDPLIPMADHRERYPDFERAELFSCVLQEGETLLIPEGWWHYAVSLSPSITVMRNFYNALTNVNGLVQLFANLRKKK